MTPEHIANILVAALQHVVPGQFDRARQDEKSAPAMKVMQKQLFSFYQSELSRGRSFQLSDTGFRNFSQFEEDGLLLFVFAAIGVKHRLFIDIGASDCINSNCANLAINHGWHGLFIDGSEESLQKGRAYYEKHPDTFAYPPKFKSAFVQRENINELLEQQGFTGEVDLVSIDIDGNDYWVWEALSVARPRVVIIETHVEFGARSIVVPYDKNYCYPGRHPRYHGASGVAMAKLAKRKGYRLVGSNLYGFNLIFVRDGEGEQALPEVPVESVLNHPSMKDRCKLDEEIMGWEFEEV